MTSEELKKNNKQEMASGKPKKNNNQGKKLAHEDIILYSILGLTGFCLFAGTLSYTYLYVWLPPAGKETEMGLKWAGEVLKDGFFLGLGALLTAFRQSHGLPPEPPEAKKESPDK